MDTIRLAGVVGQSIVDGPGLRFVVFTQGCPHGCPGCHNPDTHDFGGGYDCPVETLLEEIDKNPLLSGVTLSGGEPFCQARALVPLARQVKRRGKHLLCYTGYTLEELLEQAVEDTDVGELLGLLDIMVDGPFRLEEKNLTLRFRGSENQRVLDVPASVRQGRAVEAVLPD